jgi:plastocyanin
MRIILPTLIFALAACSARPPASTEGSVPPVNDGGAATVRLSNFAFDPAHIGLKKGVAVRLRLVNDSDGAHNFSAAAFFAASSFPSASRAPVVNGEIEVGSHQTVEVVLVPGAPGTFPLECTHFLHGTFGMSGTLEVMP